MQVPLKGTLQKDAAMLVHLSNEKTMVIWLIKGIIPPSYMEIYKKKPSFRIPMSQPGVHVMKRFFSSPVVSAVQQGKRLPSFLFVWFFIR